MKKIIFYLILIILIIVSIYSYNNQITVSSGSSNEILLNNINDTHLYNKRLSIYYLGENGCKQAVKPLHTLLETEKNKETISTILVALGKIHTEEAYQIIIEYLNDNRTTVQLGAITAISKFDTTEVEEILIQKMLFDNNKSVREASAVELKKFQTEEVYQAFITTLTNEKSSKILIAVLDSITYSQKEEFITPVFQLIETSKNNEVKQKALYILGEYQEYEDKQNIIQFLMDIISSDEKIKIKEIAIRSIGYLGNSQNTDYLVDLLLNSTDNKIIKQSAFALNLIHDQNSIEPLIYTLQNNDNKYVKEQVIYALLDYSLTNQLDELIQIFEAEQEEHIIPIFMHLLAQTNNQKVIKPICLKYLKVSESMDNDNPPLFVFVDRYLSEFETDVLIKEINQIEEEYPGAKENLNFLLH